MFTGVSILSNRGSNWTVFKSEEFVDYNYSSLIYSLEQLIVNNSVGGVYCNMLRIRIATLSSMCETIAVD